MRPWSRGVALPLLASCLVAVAGVAMAQAQAQTPPRHPPPEAVAACDSLQPGDACTVELPARQMDGVCRAAPRHEGALVCAPDGPPPGGGRHGQGPPPEALAACDGAQEGDVCTVVLPAREIDGTCRDAPRDDDGTLACVPPDFGPPPR